MAADRQRVLMRLVGDYADALGRFGPDSPKTRAIRSIYAHDGEFLLYADALDAVKRCLGGSGMGPKREDD